MDAPPPVPTTDPDALTAILQAAAPMNRTLGLAVVSVGETAVLRLPNDDPVRNHVGGPHAGAIFTLGETSAATLMMARLGHLLGEGVALAVRAEIAWTKVATCAVISRARMGADPEVIEAEFRAGGRPEWTTHIEFTREDDGAPCAEMTVVLTLVRPRTDQA